MLKEKLYHRFLNLLGVNKMTPSLPYLSELIKAHLSTIPFENISKLYYRHHFNQKTIPDFKQYLEGIAAFHFGGTCYSNNYYFFKLLGFLGFEVKLCAADMKKPGTHMVIAVTIDRSGYLVDVGYAAPFTEPVPLERMQDHIINHGRDRYIFKPRDEAGSTRLIMFRNGSEKHGYTVRPEARRIEDFSEVISGSFLPDSTFFRSLLLTRLVSGRFTTIHNFELIESGGKESQIYPIKDLRELTLLIETLFNIPASVTGKVIRDLDLSGDPWD